MIKKIYLTRHGQTDFNKKGIVQGSGIDSDLNDLGNNQANAFFNAYKDIPFDRVYTSALKRTHQSVKAFIEKPLPHESLPELNEISWGDREGVVVDAEGESYYKLMLQSWREGKVDFGIDGGESPIEVAERLRHGLHHILNQTNEECILICMHGRAMRIMLAVMLNYPLKCMDMFEHSNLCLYRLNYTGSMFTIESYNDTAHLSGLSAQ
ncbi:histidine phosphatase family protein [Roseivirga sp.]|uniref:histidine phosphatase family protein n=1 Tax=Roseivirga sp. TaxID=1964215 RepID=UPI003BA87BC3